MLRDYVEDFLLDNSADWDKKTMNWYRWRVVAFCDYVADVPPAELSSKHVARYLGEQRRRGIAWSTRNGTYTCLGVFFRWLVREGVVPANPFHDETLKRPKKERQTIKPLKLDYARRMIETALAAARDGDLYALRDLAIMHVFASTGVRRCELVNIRLEDMDLDQGELWVKGKMGHERTVYLKPEAIAAIRNWLEYRPQGSKYLFNILWHNSVRRIGERLRTDAINEVLKKWRDKAGIDKSISVSPHKWRHMFASVFAAQARNVYALKDLLGHSDIKITEIYVHLDPKQLKEMVMDVDVLGDGDR